MLRRRFTPLYIAAFLQGLVLWYAVEKLFMLSIGFTPTGIGLMAACYSAVMLLIETPSGILADRWSRKGVLILAGLALAVSSLVCGLSTNVVGFIIGAGFWGVFYALYSGTYDSIVYDTLLEETGHADQYERYFGYVRIYDGVALIIGSLCGGLLGSVLNLRATFFLTIPIAVLSIVALWFFREPLLHKAEAPDPLFAHIKSTFAAVLHRNTLMSILFILLLAGVGEEILTEFNQLWIVAVNTPVAFYGFTTAIALAAYAVSGSVAPKLQLKRPAFVMLLGLLLVAAGSALILSRSTWLLAFSQGIIILAAASIGIIYLGQLHDRLPSKVRAGASSAVSTINRVIFIACSFSFGWLTEHTSVFIAGWMVLVPVTLLAFLILYQSYKPDPAN